MASLGAGGAYLTNDAALAAPRVVAWDVQDCLPMRTQLIAERGVGVDPDAFRRRLKLRGDNAGAIVLTRVGRRELAIVVERLPAYAGTS